MGMSTDLLKTRQNNLNVIMFKNKNGEKDRRRMVMNKNYQKELEELLLELDNQ